MAVQFLERRSSGRGFLFSIVLGLSLVAVAPSLLWAEEATEDTLPPDPAASGQIKKLVERARKSVVVITIADRDSAQAGLGSGVIVRADGLIATNLHVLGQGRAVRVRLFDGREVAVKSIYSHEKSQDLALLQVDADNLPALELGDSDDLEQGEPVIALGNPRGLAHSVVSGIVSGLRADVDGMSMIQLAMPIEQGNSGGPVLDMEGKIVGLVTLKSRVTENLGYAVVSNSLKPLLADPHPIAMSKWLTMGRLNPKYWTSAAGEGGVQWTQRASRIRVEGTASGFGGRSLCLSTAEVPAAPYEVGVTVKLDQEDGAAGLVFCADGQDRHYGFYPSSQKLRFTWFDGATVYDWHVLKDEAVNAYRPHDWNELKVRIEDGRFLCFCNGERVFEVKDKHLTVGRVGLAKFRHTQAEFRRFAVGANILALDPEPELSKKLSQQVVDLSVIRPPGQQIISEVQPTGAPGRRALLDRAKFLEEQAARIRQLAKAAYEKSVREELQKTLNPEKGEANLLTAALLISALDNEDLDIEAYRRQVDDLAAEFRANTGADVEGEARLKAFHHFLFEESGFHGSHVNFNHASNSYVNEVLDDREGLPITLAVIYMELAERIGLKTEGVGLPYKFVVRWKPAEGTPVLINVFDEGHTISTEEAIAEAVKQGATWKDDYLSAQTPSAIIVRMLRNLIRAANDKRDSEASLRYVEAILAIEPESVEDRLFKALLCYNSGRITEGIEEADWLLKHPAPGLQAHRVQQLREALEEKRRATP